MIIPYVTIMCIIVIIVIIGYSAYVHLDCYIREEYWNKNGLFVDCWDCNTNFVCDYPEIPKEVNNKSE